MKINCLICGHRVELDDAYTDYQGLIKCFVCGSLLEIKTREGKVESVSAPKKASAAAPRKDIP